MTGIIASRIVLGSRGSALARRQTELVRKRLLALHPGLSVSVAIIRTTGDRTAGTGQPPAGKSSFVKEIEEQLLLGRIDLAVHSMKDMPAALPPGLALLAVPCREDPRDVLVTRSGFLLSDLSAGAVIGTSSPRRKALLLSFRRDLDVRPIRGNVDTRLRKIEEGGYDATILAMAGLKRLDLLGPMMRPVDEEILLPAPGQGAIAVEGREERDDLRALVSGLVDEVAATATAAERAFAHKLGASCLVPVGALAELTKNQLRLRGVVASLDGTEVLKEERTGDPARPEELGLLVADLLLSRGADWIIHGIR